MQLPLARVVVATIVLGFAACLSATANGPASDSASLDQNSALSASKPGFFQTLIDNQVEQAKAVGGVAVGENLFTFGVVGATTLVLLPFDAQIDKRMRTLKDRYAWVNTVSPRITTLGSTNGILGVVGFGTYGFVFSDIKAQETTLLTAQALITSGLWTRLIKIATARERPSAEYVHSHQRGGEWSPLDELDDDQHLGASSFDAFPSGHTATAFSIATVFAEQYADKPLAPVIAYSTASIVGISRMTEHAHWMSDVFVGGAIGYLCGEQVVAHNRTLDKHTPEVFYSPNPDSKSGIVGLEMKW